MTYSFDVIYHACQSCSAKIHCEKCDLKMESALLSKEGIESVYIRLAGRELSVKTDMDEDDLVDCLEDLGLFV